MKAWTQLLEPLIGLLKGDLARQRLAVAVLLFAIGSIALFIYSSGMGDGQAALQNARKLQLTNMFAKLLVGLAIISATF